MRSEENSMGATPERVGVFKATDPLLTAMLEELRKFALKKPEATLSKQKVSIVNRLLADLKELLTDEPNSKYLDLLTDDDLPQYSDVVLILSQYEAAMRAFRERHYKYINQEHVWVLQDGENMEDDEES
jgi:hypothetical protein